ncbi:hypothetical protein [Nostoc sphaeroides]|uniref:Uncharacterized protein n=1 Tax=Nostoc sphaeroides CCNUC1 TaxID=2653204 RepID=A0A5P8VYA2_9NOSO|nr:hypothetical protein [Nostoc sphaeroides]QFS45291.1 hypothetical protein GXM_02768 [Nostoc sphaeroides CCNUC1]
MNINRPLGIEKEIFIPLCAKLILDSIWQNITIAAVVGLTVFSRS